MEKILPVFILMSLLLGACASGGTSIGTPAPTSEPSPSPIPTTAPEKARIIAYFASWGVGARGYTVAQIPADKITTINYAFGGISPSNNKCTLGDPTADINRFYSVRDSVDKKPDAKDGLHGNFNQILKLKKKYAHLQVLISIGGYNGSGRFSDMALTESSRQEFVSSCIALYLEKYAGVFDGIDVDWEYPVNGGAKPGRPEDKHNFTLLLAEFRKQLDAKGQADGKVYLLTIATSAGPAKIANLELDQIHPYLDWINLMTYDFHGAWDKSTGFNSPLYKTSNDPAADPIERDRFNIDATVQAYLKGGVPADKLVVGVAFYGRGWKGVPDQNHGLYQQADGAAPGIAEPGVFAYSEIARNYLPTYQRFWSSEAQVPWIYNPQTGIWITYDDPESIGIKADYVLSHGLGGIMAWELSFDGGELLNAIAGKFGKQ